MERANYQDKGKRIVEDVSVDLTLGLPMETQMEYWRQMNLLPPMETEMAWRRRMDAEMDWRRRMETEIECRRRMETDTE